MSLARPSARALPSLLAVVLLSGVAATPPEKAVAAREVEALPGARLYPPELQGRLADLARERGPAYRPRTRHLRPDGTPRYTNRLFLETSPYLLQHAHNPVDWYPWGDEAFEAARARGVPVLLSIGYSTCHWCHVMEEESFEDEEIARLLNERYVAIKVDREERPDVDSVYMTAVQALTGSGGWPMTVWLTPDRRPFYGGTYFPARDGERGASVGFLTLLVELHAAYLSKPAEVERAAARVVEVLVERLRPAAGGAPPTAEVLDAAFAYYEERFDQVDGGIAGAPKFPSSLPVRLLLRHHARTGDPEAREMAELTLEKMAAGGMYDHVGGGFHRYSTDAHWLLPHFEKMLYDNALLCMAYLDGYQVSGDEGFRRVAEEVLRYVERDMTSPEGAFYAATDADSLSPEGRREEGWFYTWTADEILGALGPDRGPRFLKAYGLAPAGEIEGRSVLRAVAGIDEVARGLRLEPRELLDELAAGREQLYAIRKGRPAPLRDEKILAAWNGLMISAFARAARVLGEERHADVAARALGFVLDRMKHDGRLSRSFQEGLGRGRGCLDDHAFVAAAALDLFEATGEARWLREAIALDRVVATHFEDAKEGGFFLTPDDGEKLLAREKPAYDGAEPAGASVHVMTLLRLHELTTDDRYRRRAVRALGAYGKVLAESPAALGEMLVAVDFHLGAAREIVIVVPRERGQAEPFLEELRRTYLPSHVLVVASPEEEELDELAPIVEGKRALRGKATAYVCQQGVCQLPVTDVASFARQVRARSSIPAAP